MSGDDIQNKMHSLLDEAQSHNDCYNMYQNYFTDCGTVLKPLNSDEIMTLLSFNDTWVWEQKCALILPGETLKSLAKPYRKLQECFL